MPDTAALSDELWRDRSSAAGIDLKEAEQLALLKRLASYREEFDAFAKPKPRSGAGEPGTYWIGNPSLGPIDASVYYALLRERKPRRVIEIGAGYSTIVAAAALAKNKQGSQPSTELVVIEPYPPVWLSTLAGVTKHINAPVQSVALAEFTKLQRGDVLFIDSSHVLKIGSDVQYEVLEILPRLASGVAVHVHDIFIPNEYPKDWVRRQKRFWTEQYIVQAFLALNTQFAVRWTANYMQRTRASETALLSRHVTPDEQPGSLWIERV